MKKHRHFKQPSLLKSNWRSFSVSFSRWFELLPEEFPPPRGAFVCAFVFTRFDGSPSGLFLRVVSRVACAMTSNSFHSVRIRSSTLFTSVNHFFKDFSWLTLVLAQRRARSSPMPTSRRCLS
jgi:hypothetical protein